MATFVILGFRQDLKGMYLSLTDKLTQERKNRLFDTQGFSQVYNRSSQTKWKLRTIVLSIALPIGLTRQFKG